MELLILFVAAGMTIGTFFIGLSLAIEASPQNEDEVMPWFWFGELFQTGANAFGA